MKTGRSLQDWAKEIERRANAKRDFMVDTRSMEMFNGEQGPQVSLELQDSRLQLGMTENAHRQIGTHLNIPAKYYELMRKENPELLVQNVNSWLEKNHTRRLVRALDGELYGVALLCARSCRTATAASTTWTLRSASCPSSARCPMRPLRVAR